MPLSDSDVINLRILFIFWGVFAIIGLGASIYFERTKTHDVTILAGQLDSESYEIAVAIAQVAEAEYPNLEVTVMTTLGSSQNLRLLVDNKLDFALTDGNIQAPPEARLVAQLYPDAFQILVRQESGIEKIEDLRGKLVGIPTEQSGHDESFWDLLSHYDIGKDDLVTRHMSDTASRYALITNAADAIFTVAAPGNHDIYTTMRQTPVRILEIDQGEALRLRHPYLEADLLPKGSYRGANPLPDRDIKTVSVPKFLMAHEDTPDSVVQQITSLIFENKKDLVLLTTLAGLVKRPDEERGTFVPLHDGSEFYYNKEEPSFLQEQAEPIALIISIIAIMFSAIVQLGGRRKKARASGYHRELIRLGDQAEATASIDTLSQLRRKAFKTYRVVVRDLEQGLIDTDGFDQFSTIYDAILQEIEEREGSLDRGLTA